jgi:hypothetical protein
MKIVLVDNYARENISDVLIAENVPESYALKIADFLNKEDPFTDRASYHPLYFSVKPDNYKLYKFES